MKLVFPTPEFPTRIKEKERLQASTGKFLEIHLGNQNTSISSRKHASICFQPVTFGPG
jgi:hypothetical protein